MLEAFAFAEDDGMAVTLTAEGVPLRCAIKGRADSLSVRLEYGPSGHLLESDAFGAFLREPHTLTVEAFASLVADAVTEAVAPAWLHVRVERDVQAGVGLVVDVRR